MPLINVVPVIIVSWGINGGYCVQDVNDFKQISHFSSFHIDAEEIEYIDPVYKNTQVS